MAKGRMNLKDFLGAIVPNIGTSVSRFSFAVLFAALFATFHVFELDDEFDLDRRETMRVSLALISAFLWSFGVALLAERQKSTLLRIGLVLVGIPLIAGLHFYAEALAFQPYIFTAALVIFVGLAPYLSPSVAGGRAAFWQFNHRLWLGAALALVGAVLFAGGLSLIIETLELLFEIDFPSKTHQKLWIIGLTLVGPVNWLSTVPHDFQDTVPEGEQPEFTSRAIGTIVKYILVPLLLVYTVILYAYAAKIGFDGALPNGRLGHMVLAYGAMGTLTILLAFPTRLVSGPLVTFFWRNWFWLTIGPVVLLFLAAYTRVAHYGITEERYLVLLAGLWLGVLAIIFSFWRSDRDIRVLPLSLMGLLLIASIGPWGALGNSIRSQMTELQALLERTGRLVDGRIVAVKELSAIDAGDSRRIRSIVYYLSRRDALPQIEPWFAGVETSPFDQTANDNTLSSKILSRLGAGRAGHKTAGTEWIVYQANKPGTIDVSSFSQLAGPFRIHLSQGSKVPEFTIQVEQVGTVTFKFALDHIVFEQLSPGGSTNLKLSTAEIVRTTLGKGRLQHRGEPIMHSHMFGSLPVGLMFQNFSGRIGTHGVHTLTAIVSVYVGGR